MRAGLAAAKRRGRRGGRPPEINSEKLDAIIAALNGGATKAAVCRTFGAKRTTLIETLARAGWSGPGTAAIGKELECPVSFLNEEQERRYGRYAGEPDLEQLARYFHLDDADRGFVAARRGAHMRLGCAVQLGTVRFLGTFLEQPDDVPGSAVTFMAVQLGIQVGSLLSEYAASRWRSRHPVEIRDRYGYRAFSEPFVQFRLNRWLYALCWTGSDRPGALFDRATAWLIAHKVLLPGVTTLERNIARVRARAGQRLWRQMLPQPTSLPTSSGSSIVTPLPCGPSFATATR